MVVPLGLILLTEAVFILPFLKPLVPASTVLVCMILLFESLVVVSSPIRPAPVVHLALSANSPLTLLTDLVVAVPLLLPPAPWFTLTDLVVEELSGKNTANLAVRVSHPIKGRTFDARHKKAGELLEHEKTIYYERMAFAFEIPEYTEIINGQELTMSVVGVKAYNNDNLYGNGGSPQKFKVGIGYKVKVCTNLCLFTDGTALSLKIHNLDQLTESINDLVNEYNSTLHLEKLKQLSDYELSEQQFATLVGRARLYNHLPKNLRAQIPELIISDSQVSTMTREYYNDDSFSRKPDGSINLWNMYNLLTGSVKSSYIDSFMDRNLNAFNFTEGISKALDGERAYHWFLVYR